MKISIFDEIIKEESAKQQHKYHSPDEVFSDESSSVLLALRRYTNPH
jgi:hypothetical protein